MTNQYSGYPLLGVCLKGVGLAVLWRDVLALVAAGTTLLSASVRRLHRASEIEPDTKERAMKEKNPVCGMLLDTGEVAGQRSFDSKTFYFCSPDCLATFDKMPQRYAAATPLPPGRKG